MTKLQEMRKQAGLTQSQLAELSGVPLRMIQQWEIGDRNIDGTKISNLSRLAIALNCAIYDLIEDEEIVELVKKVTL